MQNGESAFFETYKRRTRVIRKTVGTTGVINGFSKEDSYIMLKRKIETTKNGNTVKLVLPFPHFLWVIGTDPGIPTEKAVQHEPQTEQENMNREHINYEEDK